MIFAGRGYTGSARDALTLFPHASVLPLADCVPVLSPLSPDFLSLPSQITRADNRAIVASLPGLGDSRVRGRR